MDLLKYLVKDVKSLLLRNASNLHFIEKCFLYNEIINFETALLIFGLSYIFASFLFICLDMGL